MRLIASWYSTSKEYGRKLSLAEEKLTLRLLPSTWVRRFLIVVIGVFTVVYAYYYVRTELFSPVDKFIDEQQEVGQ